MPRFLKIIFTVVGTFILIIVGAAMVAHHLVSRHDNQFLRDRIEERTLAATGFRLQVRGLLELPYSLMPTVIFRDVVLLNPEYDGEINLLEAEELRIQFAVLPLLRGEVLIYESSLSGVKLNLEENEDGEKNWITGGQTGSATGIGEQLAVHTVDLHQLNVSYRNKQDGTTFDVGMKDINLRAPLFDDQIQIRVLAEYAGTPMEISGTLGSSEDILSGNAFPIDLDADIYDVDIDLSGRIDTIEEGEVTELLLRLEIDGRDLRELEGITGVRFPETSHFAATATITGAERSMVLSDVFTEVGWQGSELELAGDVANILEFAGIDMRVSVSGSDARQLTVIHDLPWLPETDTYELAGTIRGSWPELQATEIQARVERNDVVADAAGAVMDVVEFAGIDIEVSVRGDDLGDLAELASLAMPRTQAYRLDSRINGAWPNLSATDLSLSLRRGDLQLDLSGAIDDLATLSGFNLGIVASGSDLSQVPELGEYDLPNTDAFDVDARFRGDQGSISATINRASARHGSHEAVLVGEIGEVTSFGNLELQLEVSGRNAAELNAVMGLNVPPTDNYRLTSDLAGGTDGISASNLVLIGGMPGARFDIRGSVGRIVDLHDVDLAIQAATEDLSSLGRYVDFKLPVSEPLEVTGNLRGTAPDMMLDNFTVRSGQTLVNGSIAVHMDDRVSLEGSVSSGVIDLTPYLVAARDEARDKAASRSDKVFSAELIDLSFLDHFDAQMTLDNLEFWSSADNAHIEQATVSMVDGSLSVEPLRLTRDDAVFRGRFLLDRQATPRYVLDMTVENVNLATFLKDLRAREIYEGRFDLALELEGVGVSVRDIAASLDGNVAAFVSEAHIPQVSTVLSAVDILFELLPWVQRHDDLVVNCGISQVELDQGLATIKLLYVDFRQLTMIAGGTVNFREETLNLRFAPRPKKRRYLAHNIDITMRGSLSEPRVASAGATKAAATAYGKYALMGPFGLLVPTSRAKTHPCVGSLQEYRAQEAEIEQQ